MNENIKKVNRIFFEFNKELSYIKDHNTKLNKIYNFWISFNSFRHCDHGLLYSENIIKFFNSLNKKKLHLKKKINYRLAYITDKFNLTGGVSFPLKIIYEGNVFKDKKFDNFFYYNGKLDYNNHHYKYLIKYCKIKKVISNENLKNETLLQQGEKLCHWLTKNKIDIVIAKPSVPILYGVCKSSVSFKAFTAHDWHTFSLAPGIGNVTLGMTYEQLYNYGDKFHIINAHLGLPNTKFIDSVKKVNLKKYNIPNNAIVSMTSNVDKCVALNSNFYLENLELILKKFKKLHHLFVSTKRSEDLLKRKIRDKSLLDRVHFIGNFDNIYEILRSVDLYINSAPVSGAVNIEAALCKVPSINLITISRRLSGHGLELGCNPNSIVSNKVEFLELASKIIMNKKFKKKLIEENYMFAKFFLKNNIYENKIFPYIFSNHVLLNKKNNSQNIKNFDFEYTKAFKEYNASIK